VNDWLGRIAWYLRSKDGINWKVDPGEAYKPGIAVYEDGTKEDWFKYERIKVLQDKYGRATQAHFAVIDTLKREDKASDRHSSKHICIPLTVGRLLTILDSEKISAQTKLIHVKVEAEENFNPQTDIDFESLRFGASEEVNFGRGCKFINSEKSGNDLVITFDGKGNGITDNNFAAKLLGKTNSGKLLFGYARLPKVDYLEPALSARLPIFVKSGNGFDIEIEIQNFGQEESKPSGLKILSTIGGKEVEISSGKIPQLGSFQKTTLKMNCGSLFAKGEKYPCKIVIESESQRDVTLNGEILPFQ
jgi:hypothetical protein